jgi:hypothetical protein
VDPTGRTLQPADKEQFGAAFDALLWPHQRALRKHEIHRTEDFVLWQEAETLTLTTPDSKARWSYTVKTEVEGEKSPGIPLLTDITVTPLARETVIAFGVQQRTVEIGMGIYYFPVSGDLRCLGLDGKERWRTKSAPCEQVLVVASPQAAKPVAYVLGMVPENPGRWGKATRVLECFDLASGQSQWRIDLPPAFAEGRDWLEVTRLEACEFSPAEPRHEILVKAGRAFGVYSARGRTLYEEKTRPVLYAAPARLRGPINQVVCVIGQEDEPFGTLAVLGAEGQVCWKGDQARIERYRIESRIAVVDLDGDGDKEIVTFDSETVSVFGF